MDLYLDRNRVLAGVATLLVVGALATFGWMALTVDGDTDPTAPPASAPTAGPLLPGLTPGDDGTQPPTPAPTGDADQEAAIADLVEADGVTGHVRKDDHKLDLELDGIDGLHRFVAQLRQDGAEVSVWMDGSDEPGLPPVPSGDSQGSEMLSGIVDMVLADGQHFDGTLFIDHDVALDLRTGR